MTTKKINLTIKVQLTGDMKLQRELVEHIINELEGQRFEAEFEELHLEGVIINENKV